MGKMDLLKKTEMAMKFRKKKKPTLASGEGQQRDLRLKEKQNRVGLAREKRSTLRGKE